MIHRISPETANRKPECKKYSALLCSKLPTTGGLFCDFSGLKKTSESKSWCFLMGALSLTRLRTTALDVWAGLSLPRMPSATGPYSLLHATIIIQNTTTKNSREVIIFYRIPKSFSMW